MQLQRTAGKANLIDVLDRVLDKGIVVDAWLRLSLAGINLITVDARIFVASFETYLKHADALAVAQFTGPVGSVASVGLPRTPDVARRPVKSRSPLRVLKPL